MSKLDRVREYMELSGMIDGSVRGLRLLTSGFARIASEAGLGDQVVRNVDEVFLAELPSFLTKCAEALAETWSDEILDHMLGSIKHPMTVAAHDLMPLYEQKIAAAAQQWSDQVRIGLTNMRRE